jgi:hypothetical protein
MADIFELENSQVPNLRVLYVRRRFWDPFFTPLSLQFVAERYWGHLWTLST